MNTIYIHSKNPGGNKTLLLASKIFSALSFFILFGLSHPVWAYEWVNKGLMEESLIDFPKQKAFTPFSSDQLQRKGYIFGIKTNFEVNTIWSKPKNKLKSKQPSNNFIDENYFSSGNDFSNELPLDEEMPIGAKPAKLIEIRF